jgi:anaerobic selenocysteine-containing dehydrogenase
MIHLGRALTDPALAPPIQALYVYSSNPAAVCPNQTLVMRGLAREDLFTVVHEQVMTDTARFADLVLPATTSMEHEDVYRSYGQFYVQLRDRCCRRSGRRAPTGRCAACWPRALGVAEAHYARTPEALIREVLAKGDASVRDITYERLVAEGSVRLELPRPYLPFADGAPTPSGKVELYSARLAARGPAGAAHVDAAARGPGAARAGRALSAAVHRAAEPLLPELIVQPVGAATPAPGAADRDRCHHPMPPSAPSAMGDRVRVESPRGAADFTARVTDATRAGVVVIEGIWWHPLPPRRPGRQRPDRRPRDRHGPRPRLPLQPRRESRGLNRRDKTRVAASMRACTHAQWRWCRRGRGGPPPALQQR